MMMTINARECEKCGASLAENDLQCRYCGTWYEANKAELSGYKRSNIFNSILNLPQGMGEFGISNNLFLVVGIAITLVLYGFGWLFEDQQFWLNETAMLIWVLVMPLTLFVIAILWRVTRKDMLFGLAYSLVVFLVHIIIIWAIRGELWDDHYGIAAFVACSSLAGWVLGRLGHGIIRWRNARIIDG
jgi:hypothetical protein